MKQLNPAVAAFFAARAKRAVEPTAELEPAPPPHIKLLALFAKNKAMREHSEAEREAAERRARWLRENVDEEDLTAMQISSDLHTYLAAIHAHDRVANDNGTWRNACVRVRRDEPASRRQAVRESKRAPRRPGPRRSKLQRAVPDDLTITEETDQLIFVWRTA